MFERAGLGMLALVAIVLAGCGAKAEAEHAPFATLPEQIATRMAAQESAWSAGDIERFMSIAYAPTDQLLFLGSSGLTEGYTTVLNQYRNSYPGDAEMGELTFNNLIWKPLGRRYGLVIGEWHLKRGEELEDLSGHYSLLWERQDEHGWVIIADHSS